MAFDDFGQVFHKSGDRAEGYYTVPGMMRVDDPAEYHPRGALFRSPEKTTALDLIGTSHWPAEYQGSAVLGGFIAGEVELHRVLDDDSGFRSEPQGKLLKSSSDAFRPVDVSVGPDGGIYVADWFNPIIGHYQTSYRDPRRDQTRGRVWRVTAKGRPLGRRGRGWSRIAFIIVGIEGDEIVASAMALYSEEADEGKIASIAVVRRLRGAGIGAQLFEECENIFRAHGLSHYSLEVETNNEPAIALYRTLGYQTLGIIDDFYAPGRHAYCMEKRVGSTKGVRIKPS